MRARERARDRREFIDGDGSASLKSWCAFLINASAGVVVIGRKC